MTFKPGVKLYFQDTDASHTVGLDGPGTVATSFVLTLPAADGSAGHGLVTDGAGNLSFVPLSGTGDMYAANNLSELTNKATARTNLQLGNVDNTSDATKTAALEAATHTWAALQTFGAGVSISSGTVAMGGETFWTREAAATWQLGADAEGVTHQTIKGPDRITSDGVGGNVIFAGGRGRGAAGGDLIFQTAAAAGAGVDGTLTTRLTIHDNGNVSASGTLTAAAFESPAMSTESIQIGAAGQAATGYFWSNGSVDFGSMADGAENTQTLSVPGAVTTDSPVVLLGWASSLPAGIIVAQAWVSAADTVSIRVHNASGGVVDPGALNVSVVVITSA